MNNLYVMDEPDLSEIKYFMHKAFSMIENCSFKGIEDVDLNSLRQFLCEALESYKQKNITDIDILNIIDAFETYLHRRYMDDYPATLYPNFPLFHPLSIGLEALNYIQKGVWYADLSLDVTDALLNFLKTPKGHEEEAHTQMKNYMNNLEAQYKENAKKFETSFTCYRMVFKEGWSFNRQRNNSKF